MHEPSHSADVDYTVYTGFWFCCRRLVCQQNQLELHHFPSTSQLVHHSQNIEMSRETRELGRAEFDIAWLRADWKAVERWKLKISYHTCYPVRGSPVDTQSSVLQVGDLALIDYMHLERLLVTLDGWRDNFSMYPNKMVLPHFSRFCKRQFPSLSISLCSQTSHSWNF